MCAEYNPFDVLPPYFFHAHVHTCALSNGCNSSLCSPAANHSCARINSVVICLSVNLSVRPLIPVSVHLSISLFLGLILSLFACLAAWLPVLLPACLPIPDSLCPPLCLSAPSSLCLSACLCRGEDKKVKKKKVKKKVGADVEILTALPAVPGAAGLEGMSR